ncbi:MAG: response regulator [Candidatus Riflebacteria bacterium]|nr:response regulator [Candidatus Riflebacteria bacterium]
MSDILKPLRLLIVDDSEDDAVLLSMTFQRTNKWKLETERVDNRESLLYALENKSWDFIIADYSIPGFSGMEALALLKYKALDIPFILVSGTVSEGTAIEAMKAGAHDVVLKENLARLIPAVERELREASVRNEKRKTQEALLEEQEKFQVLFESAPASIIEIDCTRLREYLNGLKTSSVSDLKRYFQEQPEAVKHAFSRLRIANLNRAALSLFESASISQISSHLIQLVPMDSWNAIEEFIIAFSEKNKGYEGESNLLTITGRQKIVAYQWQTFPVSKFKGEEILLSIVDLTDRKLFEAINKSRAELEAASRTKDRFLANIIHELRNPLNPIIGFTELLFETDLNKVQKSYIQIINQRSKDLMDLINELLEFSKIEAGEMRIFPTVIEPEALMREVYQTMAPTAERKGLKLLLSIEEGLPGKIFADPLRLKQILMNLLSNSLKFTHEGSIEIRIEKNLPQPSSMSDTITLRFSVKDTGIGIPQEKHERIFLPFVQASDSTAQKYGGTGLGLPIVKRLIELMRGNIWFTSDAGKGSTFFFTVTAGIPDIEAELPNKVIEPFVVKQTHINENASENHILVVEDEASNRLLVVSLLKKVNYIITAVGSAVEAIEKFKSEKFDLILMDIQLPDIDGMEVTRRMRALEKERNDGNYTPILALSAYTLEKEQKKFLESGMDGCVNKPINRVDFFNKITETINKFPVKKSEPAS